MMSILEKILNWTQKIPNWQSDAARRLFQQDGKLSENDIRELYQLLKISHGVIVENQVKSVPLSKEHMPTISNNGRQILLTSMHSLSNVNRLPSDQVLGFAQDGLTIVYGGNGSGKSGYARVLKQACRARDVEKVLPDMSQADVDQNIPTASFDITIEGIPHTITWNRDAQTTPDELSSIAVFDSHCARVYLTEENEIAYLPYGLDVLECLANDLLPELNCRLDSEIANINVEKSHLGQWDETTKAGAIIMNLKSSSDIDSLQQLANITAQEMNRIREIDEALKLPDPLTKAEESKVIYQQLKELAKKIENLYSFFDDTIVSQVKLLHQNVLDAESAVKIIAENLRSNETLLPRTGDTVWRELFEVARRFYTQDAMPDTVFPPNDPSALCPLCQNPLNNAVDRLKRFDDFIREDSSQKANYSRQQLENEKKRINNLSASIEIGTYLESVLKNIMPDAILELAQFENQLRNRKKAIISILDSSTWTEVPRVDCSIHKKIRKRAAHYCREMRIHFKAADPVKSKQIQDELKELQSRKQLTDCLEQVKDLIQRMKEKEALTQCKKSLTTTGISKKSKEFASEFVTEDLKNAMDREFKYLGIGYIKAKLSGKSVKGVTKLRLLLDFPKMTEPNRILSEGEQRALALSSFLAELDLSQHKGGIVFDDPVSSLDHWRRKDVAKRLVDEAKTRQVIIFTHDTVFLSELRESAEKDLIPVTVNHLEWNSGVPGYVNDGLPWEHKSVKDRIDQLEKAQRKLAKTWQQYPNEEQQFTIRSLYSKLRATIERVVEKDVFNEVVCRYRDWVNISHLFSVVGFNQSECDQINFLHKRCCDATDAHDTSSNRLQSVPTPQELEQDIAKLSSLVESIKARKPKKKK